MRLNIENSFMRPPCHGLGGAGPLALREYCLSQDRSHRRYCANHNLRLFDGIPMGYTLIGGTTEV